MTKKQYKIKINNKRNNMIKKKFNRFYVDDEEQTIKIHM